MQSMKNKKFKLTDVLIETRYKDVKIIKKFFNSQTHKQLCFFFNFNS